MVEANQAKEWAVEGTVGENASRVLEITKSLMDSMCGKLVETAIKEMSDAVSAEFPGLEIRKFEEPEEGWVNAALFEGEAQNILMKGLLGFAVGEDRRVTDCEWFFV